MKPFRAPRSGTEDKGKGESESIRHISKVPKQARRSPRRTEKSHTEPQVIPFRKGIKMMSERESIETSQYGEVQRWSSDSEAGDVHIDMAESEEPTEFGVVWERYVIKETQEAQDAENKSTTVELHIMNPECQTTKPTTIWEEALPSEESSPRMSEFESDGELPSKGMLTARQRTDAYWEDVLQSEVVRLQNDTDCRTIAVEDITFDVGCHPDDWKCSSRR